MSHPKICIVGCGIAGLTTALSLATRGFTNISVYEHASNLGFVGAGIQLAPNMARILDRLGVWTDIQRTAVVLHDTSIRDGVTGDELANVQLDDIKAAYGFHHMVGHRHGLVHALYEGCLGFPNAISFHFATTVGDIRSVTAGQPSFTATPRDINQKAVQITCDVLLGCDGIKSQTRTALLASLDLPVSSMPTIQDTKQAAYRIMIPRDLMLSSDNKELHELIDRPRATRWIASKRHIIAYPIENNTIYNLSTAQPDSNFSAAPGATYTTKGSKDAMLTVFQDFCPTVQDMLKLVPEGEVCEWKLRVHSPLPTWVSGGGSTVGSGSGSRARQPKRQQQQEQKGKEGEEEEEEGKEKEKEQTGQGCIALVGDACHPTLPHLAQGAAQAIEDATVLAICLEKLRNLTLPSSPSLTSSTSTTTTTSSNSIRTTKWWTPQTLHQSLKIYESLRKSRAEFLVETAAASGRSLHLDEGIDRDARNQAFAQWGSNMSVSVPAPAPAPVSIPTSIPDKWADPEVQKMIYGFDCQKQAEDEFERLFSF